MEPINYNYSLKNIPISSNKDYLKCLLSKIESFIIRVRWRAFFFENGSNDQEDETGMKPLFKSNRCPPQNDKLLAFEDDLYEIVKCIEFKPVSDPFLNKLKTDLNKIKESPNMLVSADKTTNLYSISKEEYEKLLTENITKSYKKADSKIIKSVNNEAKEIAKSLKLDRKMKSYAEKNAFITLKDHKTEFQSHPKCRLINPAKSEMGIVSKMIVDRINTCVLEKTQFNQWKNTTAVLDWFASIKEKKRCKFLKFDVVDFYPSISKTLLEKSIEFAKEYTEIGDTEIAIIMNARKSLLFYNGQAWVKKNDDDLFDVTQGSYDGAEICELVGLFMLSRMENHFGKNNIGLYRDDGLSVLKNKSGRERENTKKFLHEIFKKYGLSITVETNLNATDFLDVTLDLPSGNFWPYRKKNSNLLYINKQSNHPPTVIKQVPSMINNRIASISSNKVEFEKSKRVYEEALKKSGYTVNMKYDIKKKNRRNRGRKVTWFNPPYSRNVKTNVGKIFLALINKHFPTHHKYHKIFNRYNVKVSYCCVSNMEDKIRRHNTRILNGGKTNDVKPCNCQVKEECPLGGKCRIESVVYQATVKTEKEEKCYVGLCATEFKTRFNNHATSFRKKEKRKATELSNYIWNLKDERKSFDVSWSILAKAAAYRNGGRQCDLCQTEKFIIATANRKSLLNKRSELVSKCRHINKYFLNKY